MVAGLYIPGSHAALKMHNNLEARGSFGLIWRLSALFLKNHGYSRFIQQRSRGEFKFMFVVFSSSLLFYSLQKIMKLLRRWVV